MGKEKRHYTSKELGYLLGVRSGTVAKWTNDKKIKCVKTPGGHRRYPKSEVERIMNSYYADHQNGVWQ